MNLSNTACTMTDVVKQFLPAYKKRYTLSPEQASVCQSIIQCQTDVLGGEVYRCEGCGHEITRYHSCGNRHCPRCKQQATKQWAEQQLDTLLPVRYYHLVFICVLHTWGQNLFRHVHLHCLIPGIALKPDKCSFEQSQSDYLYPVEAMKRGFRGKMVYLY